MRILSSLLLATLATVVSAAPATPRVLVEERRVPDAPADEERQPAERETLPPTESFVARGPVLAGPERHATHGEGGHRRLAEPTTEEAPALQARRLSARPAYRPPVPDTGAEPRAGLRDLPPPRA